METYRGHRIVIGTVGHNPETNRLERICEIRHVESGERIVREEVDAAIPVDVVLEAARQRIVDSALLEESTR